MNYIKGKVRNMIFESDNGYKVGLFRIKETNDDDLKDYVNKTITFTGYFAELNGDDYYIFNGQMIDNERYGMQYQVSSYEREEPKGKDAVIEFLSSSLIKGCGEKTAEAIVSVLGDNALSKIKEDYHHLLIVPGISEVKAKRIYNSIVKYQSTDEMIVKLKSLGFSIQEALNIINKYGENAINVVESNIYSLIEVIDFAKLDKIFLKNNEANDSVRINACIVETFKELSMSLGDTYFFEDEIYNYLKTNFHIYISLEIFLDYLGNLCLDNILVMENGKYYLREYYDYEYDIAKNLLLINSLKPTRISDFNSLISDLETTINVKYNVEQKKAIKGSLEKRVSIITGGPGTGKTTIINAIVKLYIRMNCLNASDIVNDIALLAPTGRASKKMSESTGLGAMTIHRFLKWNKEKNEFQINEFNKNNHKLIIVDEVSMIDTFLFDSLLKGINSNIKLILVGDTNQLPSVGPGLVLNDLIGSNCFNHFPLERIYRQSINSYIPVLAKEIKECALSSDFVTQKDDYNFLIASGSKIKEMIKKICEMSMMKGLTEEDIQILVPMYKGENGIDNLNVILQKLFNPPHEDKNEIKVGDIIYREHDKILQLVNSPDNNVYNGDIGYIEEIKMIKVPKKKEILVINFDGTRVEYTREDLNMIRHAYAISIHKSQGSEFSHVIMPVSKGYYKMLYNKLIYTGVSRAKKSLVIIGETQSFMMAVNNNYSAERKTTLMSRIVNL
ncbi:MAG: ATP-dependent RecD-like DNA helicase [Bacilli bacterium]